MAAVENYKLCNYWEGTKGGGTSSSTYSDKTSASCVFLNHSGVHIVPEIVTPIVRPGQVLPANYAEAFRRAQKDIERDVFQSCGLPRYLMNAQGMSTYAQQQTTLSQQNLETAIEQLSGVPQHPPVSNHELGNLYARYHNERLGEFPVRMGLQDMPVEPVHQDVPTSVSYSDEYLADKKKREEAEEKAQELLSYMIGEKQMEVYRRTNKLFVKGKKYEYIIQKNGYIIKLEKNKVINLCVHLEKKYSMPLTDNVIAMKLRIENEEKNVLKLANKWDVCERETYVLPECAGMAQ